MLDSTKQVLKELVDGLYYIDLPVYSLYNITSVRISYTALPVIVFITMTYLWMLLLITLTYQ